MAAAAALIRDFDAFGVEASSAEPRHGSLARIGDDLVQTAAKVSGVAAPLIGLVERSSAFFRSPAEPATRTVSWILVQLWKHPGTISR